MTSHFHDRLYDANTEHKTCSIYTTTVDGKVKAVWSSYFYPSGAYISVESGLCHASYNTSSARG